MSAFYTDPGLDLFVNEFSKMVDSCPSARGKLEALTDFYLDKFYEPTDRHEQSRTMQRMNVIHAAGFGIYVTEKLGYRKQIYKDKSGLLQTCLYKESSELLAKVLGKDHLEREFIELTPLLP